jgi:hypothetical protein
MKKTDIDGDDDLLPEYDFSQMKGGVQGKYVERYREGTNLVLLDPDVAAAFPDAKAVNNAISIACSRYRSWFCNECPSGALSIPWAAQQALAADSPWRSYSKLRGRAAEAKRYMLP